MAEDGIHTDKELFEQTAVGSIQAFELLFLKYTSTLYPIVLKMVNSEVWAEDIIQNVFTKLWSTRQQLSEIENPGGYLYRMATRTALDFMKHNQVEIKAQYHIARQLPSYNRNFTQERLDYKMYEQLLEDAVIALPAQRKKVYELKFKQNFTNEQIADQLSISVNTVRVHAAEGLQSIRNYLKKSGVLTFLALITSIVEVNPLNL